MSEAFVKMLEFFGLTSIIGWIMFFVGIGARREQRRREESEHTRATGRIVDYARKQPPARSGVAESWRPIIEFTADGQRVRREYENRMDPDRHPVGEEVDVLYNVSDPTKFHLDTDEAFSRGSGNIMRIAFLWIAFCAVLSLVLAVFVGGLQLDVSDFGRSLARLGGRKAKSVQTTFTEGAFEYNVKSDSSAFITEYSGDDERLMIPSLLGGHIVKGFSGASFARASNLLSLIVPPSIDSLPPMSFFGCVRLSELTLMEGVRSIDTKAFGMCLSLRDVTLPASLTSIADDTFPEDCEACFHVAAGSEAERFCREKGYSVEVED